jgi:hypothetical protein
MSQQRRNKLLGSDF